MLASLRNAASCLARRPVGSAVWAVFALTGSVSAAEVRVAVAANFAAPMAELTRTFEAATGHTAVPVTGSSGLLYAQILQGAPYDVFFSADRERVEALLAAGRGVPGSDFVYARGRLVLWSADPTRVDASGAVLAGGGFRHLAIANARLAPYGRAAEEVLRARGLWRRLEPLLVRGENVSQAYQFVASGAAELGFVARSQVLAHGGSSWEVPAELHRPIEQAAVAVRDSPEARLFLAHVRSPAAAAILNAHGYEVP